MKYIYKFLSILTISVLMFSSYASYATGCCCIKGGMDKAKTEKSDMPCHKNMVSADKESSKASDKSEGGKCCSGKCDCKFTLSVKLPASSAESSVENIEFSFLYFFYTRQAYNSVSPASLYAPPKA